MMKGSFVTSTLPEETRKDTDYKYLCSHTAQVSLLNTNLQSKRTYERALVCHKLRGLNHFKKSARISSCGATFVHTQCQGGHAKYVRMRCKNDFCPTCGSTWSQEHKRRATRAMDRLVWGNVLGYMVYTLPGEISQARPDKEALKFLSKKAWEISKRNFDTEGGMVRTHLMGEKSESLHVHFNVLFPLRKDDTIGKVSQATLDTVRREWANVVNGYFELGDAEQNCYYKFVWELGKRIHKVKYVTRPIVTHEKFLKLSDEDTEYILYLQRWHNTRWFGQLANNKYKDFLKSQNIPYTKYADRNVGLTTRCPICKEKFKYVGVVSRNDLPGSQGRWKDNNTFIDLAIHARLKSDEGGTSDGEKKEGEDGDDYG